MDLGLFAFFRAWKGGLMNERQKKFADEYLISGVAYNAALKAGYSEKYAKARSHLLLENVGIKAYIDERLKELEKEKIAKQDEVMQVFTSILRQELMEEVIELNAMTGQFVKTKKPPSIAEVIKAGSEIMKRYPTAKQSEKLELEIKKLKEQLDSGVEGTMNVNIINTWEDIPDDDD
nr:MAG: Terminase small subunit [Bacteriophage sp.]